jgi:diphosphomevalonate decarboxylase
MSDTRTDTHIVVHTEASPSLAVVKYWGKKDDVNNIAATPSLAVTLSGLSTRTVVHLNDQADTVHLDGALQSSSRFSAFFDAARKKTGCSSFFSVKSTNSFPTAAGLASSSSGFAALALGCCVAAGVRLQTPELSRLARIGSGSAARAVFGGFTVWPEGAEAARQLRPASFWPELRIVVVMTTGQEKSISSRDAMNHTRYTSPYYKAWTTDAHRVLEPAIAAVERRDLEALGHATRLSYLRMFGTMISADPPVLYWLPESVGLIRLCETLRSRGIAAWETMDAGPQVKILTNTQDIESVIQAVHDYNSDLRIIAAGVGEGVKTISVEKPGAESQGPAG